MRLRIFSILMIVSPIISLTLLSCQSKSSIKNQDISGSDVIIQATVVPAVKLRADQQDYYFEYQLQNRGFKDLHVIEAKIYFIQDNQRIQEVGPVTLYSNEVALKPSYLHRDSVLLKPPRLLWDGNQFAIEITKASNQKPTLTTPVDSMSIEADAGGMP